MLTDFLYKYISSDKDCLLGLIPDENKFAALISPLNANTLYPSTSSTETSYWIKKQSIVTDNNVKILNKSFVSDDANNDWSISTRLNLLGNIESTGSNFTFSSKFKINTSNIGNTIIPLFKQGGIDVNDTLDIHFEFNRNSDSSGSLDKLIINVYYESPSDSVALNLQSFELFNIWTLIDKDVQLTVVIDSENSIIKVFSNDNLIGSKVMDLSKILGLPLNTPQNRSGNMNLIIGGSKFLEMKNVYIWKRALSLSEVQFLNKINSERIEKIENLPEDIDSLTFMAVENSSLKMIQVGNPVVNGIQYRTSLTSSWKPYNIGDVIELPKGFKVQFKNTNEQLSTSSENYVQFVMAGKIKGSGNIQSMLNYSEGSIDGFYNLFFDCDSLILAPENWPINYQQKDKLYLSYNFENEDKNYEYWMLSEQKRDDVEFILDENLFNQHQQWYTVSLNNEVWYIIYVEDGWYLTMDKTNPINGAGSYLPMGRWKDSVNFNLPPITTNASFEVGWINEGSGNFDGWMEYTISLHQ